MAKEWQPGMSSEILILGGQDAEDTSLSSWLARNAAELELTPKEQYLYYMDALANSINTKAGTAGKKSIPELTATVDTITLAITEQSKTVALNMTSGDQTITPDSNKVLSQVTIEKPNTLVASNIKFGVNIGGVSGIFTADADATTNDILNNKTGYVNGTLVTGNITSLGATTYNTSSSNQIISSSQYLSDTQTIKAVTTSGIETQNILRNVTIKVGDINDDDRIISVTGIAPNEEDMYEELNDGTYGEAEIVQLLAPTIELQV